MATNIKAIRKLRGMTQEELAKASGIHSVTICKYEIGKVVPSLDNAEKLARALGVTVNDLIAEGRDDRISDNQASGGAAGSQP